MYLTVYLSFNPTCGSSVTDVAGCVCYHVVQIAALGRMSSYQMAVILSTSLMQSFYRNVAKTELLLIY